MRVLFVCPNLQAGGAERHWSILLPRLAARGFDVRALTLDGRGPFFDVLEQSGVPMDTTADAGRRRIIDGAGRVLRTPTDVIISRATSADGLSLLARTSRPRVKWAANWHHPAGMPIHGRHRTILRGVLPRADAVIAVSSSQIDELTELGVRRDAIDVVPNGTDFVPAPETRAQARIDLGLIDTDVAFLLVGRLEGQKRIDRFIEAIAVARRTRPDVIGLVAGSGPDHDSLYRYAATLGSGVQLLGRRADMPRVLAAADALCLVSDHEALPFVVLEAMASALPVIATRVGGLPEVIVDGETGQLLDVGDADGLVAAIVRLAGDPEARSRMGAVGRARQLALYAAEPMADAYAALLRRLGQSTTC